MHVMKTLCCAAAISLLAVSGAHADEWNKKTYLTFSGPVQIPGATLPAGTYLFQLADPDNARHVVMVASKDGSKIYGMFITIPNDRLETPDENVVMFGEAPAGAPQAVQAWWYPGERIGEEFVYPKNQAMALAKANHRQVLATDSDLNGNGSESDRMSSLRGSKVGRVDENGTMNGDTANNTASNAAAATTTAANNTADSVNKANRAQSTTAQSTTTAPANTVDGRNATTTSGSRTNTAKTNTAPAQTTTASSRTNRAAARTNTARSNTANNAAVGTSGQAANTADNNTANGRRNRRSLPRTASSLALVELLSGLSLVAGLSLRRVRRAAEAR